LQRIARRAPSDCDPGNGAGSIVEPSNYRPLLDGSPQLRAIETVIENVADTDATVL